MEPEVKFHSIGIMSDDFGEINTPLPVNENQRDCILFTLREGSEYRLKLTFSVLHNIVSGLTYSNTVWKGGVQGVLEPGHSSLFGWVLMKSYKNLSNRLEMHFIFQVSKVSNVVVLLLKLNMFLCVLICKRKYF